VTRLPVFRVVLLACMPAAAFAIPIYSTNGTATPTFTPSFFWLASSSPAGAQVSVEMRFIATTSGTVDSIVAALSASLADVTFAIRTDAMGFAALLIDMFTFHGVTGTPQLLTALSTNHALLTAGTAYWLEAMAPVPGIQSQSINWYYAASPMVMGTVEVENPLPAVIMNQSVSAFAVIGADVPEPCTLGVIGFAFLAGICRRNFFDIIAPKG
jgi:hypothetical protein